MAAAALAATMLVASSAEAGAPLPAPTRWAWPEDREVFYHVETALLAPGGELYQAKRDGRGLELRAPVLVTHLAMEVSCTADAELRRWYVTCAIGWITIDVTASEPRWQAVADHIAQQWETKIAHARVEFFLGTDGRLAAFDLVDIDGSDRFENDMIRQQTGLLKAACSLFDFRLPPRGDDWVRGWTTKNRDAVLGSGLGASEVRHVHAGDEYGYVSVRSTGVGTFGAVGSYVGVRLDGSLLFDAAEGIPAYRDVTVGARSTASSTTGPDVAFYWAALQRVDAIGLPGTTPLSMAALHAPRVAVELPPPDGVPLVPYAELGMLPLYVEGLPEAAKALGLRVSSVEARVLVGGDGAVMGVQVSSGYAVLATPTATALERARFTARGSPYATDVAVEWRP